MCNGKNGDEGDPITICHETPSGQKQTLILPRMAALSHLAQHPLDTIGECETLTDEVAAVTTAPDGEKAATPKPKAKPKTTKASDKAS